MNASDVAYLLQERVKELECHNQLSLLLNQVNLDMEELLDKTVGLIEQAFQFPDYTLVKIALRGYVSQSVLYVETPDKLVQPILIDDKPSGEIVVCYAQGFPKPEETFFEEERKLLLTVALRLGKYMDKLEKDAALQKSENLYRSILRSSPDSVTITDMDGTIRIASPSAHKLMGTDPNGVNLIGRNIFEVVLPEDRGKALEAVQSIASKNDREPSEYRVQRMDGSILEVEANADYIRDEKGVPIQMIVITRNVTERNQAARKLLESQNE
jgi:PAS domain S-box-containing protein